MRNRFVTSTWRSEGYCAVTIVRLVAENAIRSATPVKIWKPMRSRRVAAWLAAGVSVALFTSACGGSGGDTAGGAGGEASAATISVNGNEPENPLIPGNTSEVGGGKVVNALFSGLVDYRPDNAEPYNVMAESIETTDSQVYTITLKPGWTFHDGTPVTAQSYVDAWNFTAYSPNGQQNGSFMSQIAGYDQVFAADPDGAEGPQEAPTPPATEMSGLRVIDETSFEVSLTAPFSVFPTTLGYRAFAPLPEAFFTDQEAWEANPIGNGPFKFVSRQPGVNIIVDRFAEWQGEEVPTIGGVEFRFYESPDAAYADVVAGNLDYLEAIPPSALVGQLFTTDLPDRSVNQTYLGNTTITFPLYDPKYQNPDLRKAISMAIDREAINTQVYDGLREPADGYIPPSLDGYVAGQCGTNCVYDPAAAKTLFDSTGFTGPIEIASNVDGAGNQEAYQAACISITNALGAECTFVPVPTFSEFRTTINAFQATTIFRTGWVADYPSIENFLNPLYRTDASSNDGQYANPQVDALLAQADAAPSTEEALSLYQEAERLVLQDMPAIPIFYSTVQAGWSERLQNVTTTQFRELDLASVTVTE